MLTTTSETKHATLLAGWHSSCHVGILGAVVAELILALIKSAYPTKFSDHLRMNQ